MLREVRRRVASVIECYRWLWRTAQSSSATSISGAGRFVACVLGDALLLAVWCLNSPLTRPVQRDRVVVPALAILTVMMLSMSGGRSAELRPAGPLIIPDQVGAVCGGALTLGALSAPGDELVAFEACADAFTLTEAECASCESTSSGWGPPMFTGQIRSRLTI